MICRHCGKTISNPYNPTCPSCGYPNPLAGGVGFWDIVEENGRASSPPDPMVNDSAPISGRQPVPKTTPPPPVTSVLAADVEKKTRPGKRTQARGALIPYAVAALSLLIMAITLTMSGKTRTDLRSENALLQENLKEANTMLEKTRNENRSLQEELHAQETAAEAETQAEPLTILHFPTDEIRSVPAGSDGVLLFFIHVKEEISSFQWEKWDNGKWVRLDFDASSRDDRFGLTLKEEIESGMSNLCSGGLKQTADGKYRVTAYSTDGRCASVYVTLELKPAEQQTAPPGAGAATEEAPPREILPPGTEDDTVGIAYAPPWGCGKRGVACL